MAASIKAVMELLGKRKKTPKEGHKIEEFPDRMTNI